MLHSEDKPGGGVARSAQFPFSPTWLRFISLSKPQDHEMYKITIYWEIYLWAGGHWSNLRATDSVRGVCRPMYQQAYTKPFIPLHSVAFHKAIWPQSQYKRSIEIDIQAMYQPDLNKRCVWHLRYQPWLECEIRMPFWMWDGPDSTLEDEVNLTMLIHMRLYSVCDVPYLICSWA